MHAIGIVCEYNPFHLGHLYHLEQSHMLDEDGVIVCCMSGDFVQRGDVAIMTKFARAEAACRCGADLVLELPLPWCMSSAETYARGAVSILAAVGCTWLSFGMETDQQKDLSEIASFLLNDKTELQIQNQLKKDKSLSYAKARQIVLEDSFGETAQLIDKPNNILAVEYLKTILKNYPHLRPIGITRCGTGHDSPDDGSLLSAKKLRGLYLAGKSIESFLPPASETVLQREKKAGRITRPDIMENLLRSRLYQIRAEEFDSLPDAADGAGRRAYHALREGRTLDETVDLAATKCYTKARMRRILLCAALGIRAEYLKHSPPYTRLLACSEKGRAYLTENRDTMEIPFLTKPAAVKKMDSNIKDIFTLGASAHDLFMLQFYLCERVKLDEDWKKGPFIV